MTKNILVVGRSTLAWNVAKLLDNTLANLVHYEVIYIPEDEALAYPGEISLIKQKKYLNLRKTLKHIRPLVEKVKSINLRESYLITEEEKYNYDAIFIDLTPSFTKKDIYNAQVKLQHILAEIKGLKNKEKYVLYCPGQTVASWQLALSISNDLSTLLDNDEDKYVKILVDIPANDTVSMFLNKNGLQFNKKGLLNNEHLVTFPRPEPVVDVKEMKNLRVDNRNQPIIDGFGRPAVSENAIIASNERNWSNLFYKDRYLSQRVAVNLVNCLEITKDFMTITHIPPAFLLTGKLGSIYSFGNEAGEGIMSFVVAKTDKYFWDKATKSVS